MNYRLVSKNLQMSLDISKGRIFATVTILLSVVQLVPALKFPPSKLPISAITSASREACAGMRARYFCDMNNPSTFHICLGRKRFTMVCPGLLHFSERTQTCDWPEVASCRRLSMLQPTEFPPVLTSYNSTKASLYTQPDGVARQAPELTTQGISVPALSYFSDKNNMAELEVAKPKRRTKKRYRIKKLGKGLGMKHSVSRWWDNPVSSSVLQHTTVTPESKASLTQPKPAGGAFLQPYKAKMVSPTNLIKDKYIPKDIVKTSKYTGEGNLQRKSSEYEIKPNSRFHNKITKVPWYRPLNKNIYKQTKFSPSLSFKKRNSRESRMKPIKPVVISPFKPFLTETKLAPRSKDEKKLKVDSSEKVSLLPYKPPKSYRHNKFISNDNNNLVSLRLKQSKKDSHRSTERRRASYPYEEFRDPGQGENELDLANKLFSELGYKKIQSVWKEHAQRGYTDTKKPSLELNEPHPAMTKPLAVKDFGSLALSKNADSWSLSEPPVGKSLERNQALTKSSRDSNHGLKTNVDSRHHIMPRDKTRYHQREGLKRTKAKASVIKQGKSRSKKTEPAVFNEWTSIHGVAGIPDYNPDQAMGFFTSKQGGLANSVKDPLVVNPSDTGRQIVHAGVQKDSYREVQPRYVTERQKNRAYTSDDKYDGRSPHIPSKPSEQKMLLKHDSSGFLQSGVSGDKHWSTPKDKYDISVPSKNQDILNLINPVNNAASKTKTPVTSKFIRGRITEMYQTSMPHKDGSKAASLPENNAHSYGSRLERKLRQRHEPSKAGYRRGAEMASRSRASSTNMNNVKQLRHKVERSNRREIEHPSHSDHSRGIDGIGNRERTNAFEDTPRNMAVQNDQPISLSKSRKTSRHTGEDFSTPRRPRQVDFGKPTSKKVPDNRIGLSGLTLAPVDQRTEALGGRKENSRFTQYSATLSRHGLTENSKHLSERKALPWNGNQTHQAVTTRFSVTNEKHPYFGGRFPKPLSSYTRPQTTGLSRITNVQDKSHSGPSEQERYPVTLNYALHGRGQPRHSQRTYALHRPNHPTSNRRQLDLPVKTKNASHYSLYGLQEGPVAFAWDKKRGPTPFDDSRFQLKEKKTRSGAQESLSGEIQPRTSPIEKYNTWKGKCSRKWCKLPSCRCAGTDIPGGLGKYETPQIVMLTFDDSINIQNIGYYRQLFNGTLRNPNGCPIKGTFFVSGDNTDYKLVREVYQSGHEIASHTISHRSPTTWWAHAGYDNWNEEVVGMRERLHRSAEIPIDEIVGMRAPFLQIGGDAQYAMLAENNFRYDTSMVTGDLHSNRKPPIWPFTLDTAPNSQTCNLTPCPRRSYPGLWEVPLVRWYGSNNMACAMPDACTIGAGAKGSLKFMKENFKRHYQRNKAPLGIFIHASWFSRQHGTLDGLAQFLDLLAQLEDVWVVSVSQALDWVQHPVPISQLDSVKSWAC
ncbi:polysaccharide deacetylase-like protein [Elysia marginata]|uniref:Polysaccharide deacetylase-like protein n=1 Tax=Elysia marginata TaxID=1093978 RepID=A0AAV4IJQ5_9GAST|nr:polysaccharide deacetylase-like protein [Elysia marginata]